MFVASSEASFEQGEAMWCLLMGDLPVGRASTMEIPVLWGVFGGVVALALCRFHRGWGFGKEAALRFFFFFNGNSFF